VVQAWLPVRFQKGNDLFVLWDAQVPLVLLDVSLKRNSEEHGCNWDILNLQVCGSIMGRKQKCHLFMSCFLWPWTKAQP